MKNKSKMLLSQEAIQYLSKNGILFELYNKGVQLNFPHLGVIYSWYPTTGKLMKEGKETLVDSKSQQTVFEWIGINILGEEHASVLQVQG